MDKNKLLTHYVFIDTQCFSVNGFNFSSKELSGILHLGNDEQIDVLISDIVESELKGKLIEEGKQLYAIKKKLLRSADKFYGHFDGLMSDLGGKLEEEDCIGIVEDAWRRYSSDTNIKVISSDDVPVSVLRDSYFSKNPPFSDKKKSEFPDAISLSALEIWSKNNKKNVYVISGDKDVEAWCESRDPFYYLPTITSFVDIHNRSSNVEADHVNQMIGENSGVIEEALKSHFLECEFEYTDDIDADVEPLGVHGFEIETVFITDISKSCVEVALYCYFLFEAEVDGVNYSESKWDNEEKRYAYISRYNFIRRYSLEESVLVNIRISPDKSIDILQIGLEPDDKIYFSEDDLSNPYIKRS